MTVKADKVFDYFKEICKIPHGSGNTEMIEEYCLDFARKHNLKAVKDAGRNVIIYADGTKGYENSEPVIIQGHFDMVCEKTTACKKDMSKDGIDLIIENGWITADGTTLGGDDGIALAYIFALLDSDDIPHPPIEALLTRDEETGMYGAKDMEPHLLKGKKVINIDSEEEGILTVSCAGGARANTEFNLDLMDTPYTAAYKISIDGLKGGHSGVDIDKHRINGVKLLGRLLTKLAGSFDLGIAEVNGGGKMNVIPKTASAVVCVNSESGTALSSAVKDFETALLQECRRIEPDVKIDITPCTLPEKCFDKASTQKLAFILFNILDGIIEMSPDIPTLVQTSVNLGVLETDGGTVKTEHLARSNAAEGLNIVSEQLTSFVNFLGGKITIVNDYPAWEYRENSPLRDTMVRVYEEMYGKKPVIAAIHAGLECGIFAEKIADADMVSFGPDIENVHTPNERMSIASVERGWEYLLRVLAELK